MIVAYKRFFIEIRNRSILLGLTSLSVSLASYEYKEVLLFGICLKSSSFSYIYTNFVEIFSTYLKLTIFIMNQIILNFFFFHIVTFIGPALYNKEYYYCKLLFYTNSIVFVISTFFFNTIVFPQICKFFLNFQHVTFKPVLGFYFEAKIFDYFTFYASTHNICFTYFQLFTFLILLFYIFDQKLEETKLKFVRKFYYLLIFLIAILFIPTGDILIQTLLFICLLLLYEFLLYNFLLKKKLTTIF